MLLIEKMKRLEKISDTQQSVVDYMFEQKERIENQTAKEIAKVIYTSPATLTRLSQKLGYRGFEELKVDFLKEQKYLNKESRNINPNYPFDKGDSFMTIANKIGNLTKETIDDTLELIDQNQLYKAVEYIEQAEVIHISAISFPLILARDFQLKMRRLGKIVEITDLVGEQLYTLPIVREKDIAIIISYSGEIPLLKEMSQIYKERNIPIIAITSLGENSIKNISDVVLEITTREKLYSKVAEFSSQSSMKLVLDILYACYFSTNFDDFLIAKKELGKRSEPGRYSTSNRIGE